MNLIVAITVNVDEVEFGTVVVGARSASIPGRDASVRLTAVGPFGSGCVLGMKEAHRFAFYYKELDWSVRCAVFERLSRWIGRLTGLPCSMFMIERVRRSVVVVVGIPSCGGSSDGIFLLSLRLGWIASPG